MVQVEGGDARQAHLRRAGFGVSTDILVAMVDASCTWHAERPGIGLCVQCRRVICAECSTRIEGVNRCRGCLETAAMVAERRVSAEPSAGADLAAGGIYCAVLFALLWATLHLALLT